MVIRLPRKTIAQQIVGEGSLVLGGGRALLLQLANKNVARGVYDHSDFKDRKLDRLFGTLRAAYGVIFGSAELGQQIGDTVYRIHERIVGDDYRANDPENLYWVHATLVDTALVAHNKFVGTLNERTEDAFYQEMRELAEVFGCPRDMHHSSIHTFRRWFYGELETAEITDQAREIADNVLHEPMPVQLRPAQPIVRFVTPGLLPASIREQYGFTWSASDKRRFGQFATMARTMNRAPWTMRSSLPNFFTWQVKQQFSQVPSRGTEQSID